MYLYCINVFYSSNVFAIQAYKQANKTNEWDTQNDIVHRGKNPTICTFFALFIQFVSGPLNDTNRTPSAAPCSLAYKPMLCMRIAYSECDTSLSFMNIRRVYCIQTLPRLLLYALLSFCFIIYGMRIKYIFVFSFFSHSLFLSFPRREMGKWFF